MQWADVSARRFHGERSCAEDSVGRCKRAEMLSRGGKLGLRKLHHSNEEEISDYAAVTLCGMVAKFKFNDRSGLAPSSSRLSM